MFQNFVRSMEDDLYVPGQKPTAPPAPPPPPTAPTGPPIGIVYAGNTCYLAAARNPDLLSSQRQHVESKPEAIFQIPRCCCGGG